MSRLDVVLLSLTAVILAMGQVLFKSGASRAVPVSDVQSLLGLVFNPTVLAALVLYAAATILYLLALQRVPLVIAYPFMALGFALVPIAGVFVLGESINASYALGLLLVIAGVSVVSASG